MCDFTMARARFTIRGLIAVTCLVAVAMALLLRAFKQANIEQQAATALRECGADVTLESQLPFGIQGVLPGWLAKAFERISIVDFSRSDEMERRVTPGFEGALSPSQLADLNESSDYRSKQIGRFSEIGRLPESRRPYGASNLRDRDLLHLMSLSNIRELRLSNCWNITPEGLLSLRSVRSLRVVDFQRSMASEAHLCALAALQSIEYLNLSHNNLTGEDLACFFESKGMRRLIVADTKVTNADRPTLRVTFEVLFSE